MSVLQSQCRDPIGPQPAQRGTCRRIRTYVSKGTLGRVDLLGIVVDLRVADHAPPLVAPYPSTVHSMLGATIGYVLCGHYLCLLSLCVIVLMIDPFADCIEREVSMKKDFDFPCGLASRRHANIVPDRDVR
jgi:hypothetical protein